MGAESQFRKLARSYKWQSRYSLSLASQVPIFDKPVSEWNELQVQLISWCHFYYNLRNDPEGPPEFMFDDDNELDKWLKARDISRKHDKAMSKVSNVDSNNAGSIKEEFNLFEFE